MALSASARKALMLEETGTPLTPTSARSKTSDEAVHLQLQQLFDDLHYRVLRCPLGKKWKRSQVLSTAMHIMIMNGCMIDDAEVQGLAECDEPDLIATLISSMPPVMKDDIEQLTVELQLVLSMATRLRAAIEDCNETELYEILESPSGDKLSQEILKHTVVAAANDIVELQRLQDTWITDVDGRLDRLSHASAIAEEAELELGAVMREFEAIKGKDGTKKHGMLSAMMLGGQSSCMHQLMLEWSGVAVRGRGQRAYRQKYEDELQSLHAKFTNMKQAAMQKISSTAIRAIANSDEALLHLVLEQWHRDAQSTSLEKKSKTALGELGANVERLQGAKKELTQSVLASVASASESGFLALVLQSWNNFAVQSKKDQAFEERVKKTEAAIKNHLKSRKDDAKRVLDGMAMKTEHGLMHVVISAWYALTYDDTRARELDDMLEGQDKKLKSLREVRVSSANALQTRVSDQMLSNLVLSILGAWRIEARVHTIDRFYTKKVESKRRQLASIESLFKSFANQIDAGIEVEAAEISTRKRPSRTLSKGGGSTSLPSLPAAQRA